MPEEELLFEDAGAPPEGEAVPYIIFLLHTNKFAVSSEYVLHMEQLGDVTPVKDLGPYCLGIVLFNDESVPVYDLRAMFGYGDYGKELQELMNERIEDHRKWVAALERSVEQNQEFLLTTDPDACAFGKWYNSFHSDNDYLNVFLRAVNEPHRKIHETGETVKRLMAEGKQQEAREAVARMKDTYYKKTLELLSQVSRVYSEGMRNMLIYLRVDGATKGYVVDDIVDIHTLERQFGLPEERHSGAGGGPYVEGLAKYTDCEGVESIVQVLDVRAL